MRRTRSRAVRSSRSWPESEQARLRAIPHSLIVSCQRFGKGPLAYQRDLLTRLTNQDDVAPLTPARWQPSGAR